MSALSGVTDRLLALAAAAAAGDGPTSDGAGGRRGTAAAARAGGPADRRGCRRRCAGDRGARSPSCATCSTPSATLRDASPRSRDAVAAVGEIVSSRIVAAACRGAGVPAAWVDARQALITDDTSDARCRWPPRRARRSRAQLVPHLVGRARAGARRLRRRHDRRRHDHARPRRLGLLGARSSAPRSTPSRDPDLDRRRRHADRRSARRAIDPAWSPRLSFARGVGAGLLRRQGAASEHDPAGGLRRHPGADPQQPAARRRRARASPPSRPPAAGRSRRSPASATSPSSRSRRPGC